MANSIQLFKNYVGLLDEVYQQTAKTAVLESDSLLVQQGANANELIIPKMEMSGLGNYDRNSGYADGDVKLTNETVQFNYERGRMFSVDAMDNEETAGVAFGKLSGEFIRTKVVPELDAVRFAQYASESGILKAEPAEYADGEEVLNAIRKAKSEMDNGEVGEEDRYLFITPTLLDLIDGVDTTVSKEVLKRFTAIIAVPQSRFCTSVDLKSGKVTDLGDETAGGYEKADDAQDINFMIIHKPAVMQITKHQAPKVIMPEANPDADAYKFGYRIYGLNRVFANKKNGIYLSTKA
ncbi:MAG: hypothetical protein II978_08515 [Clostridia bacterium]|nr:hypothetical protein [Clostridia bacterium]